MQYNTFVTLVFQDDQCIMDQLRIGNTWEGYKASLLKLVVIKNSERKKKVSNVFEDTTCFYIYEKVVWLIKIVKQELGCFQSGAASSSCLRLYKRKPEQDEFTPQPHPFQVLGSVVVGYYWILKQEMALIDRQYSSCHLMLCFMSQLLTIHSKVLKGWSTV